MAGRTEWKWMRDTYSLDLKSIEDDLGIVFGTRGIPPSKNGPSLVSYLQKLYLEQNAVGDDEEDVDYGQPMKKAAKQSSKKAKQ
jgi:hypothetical protein